MDSLPRSSRAVWWAFTVAGVAALATVVVAWAELVPPLVAIGTWQLIGGAAIAVALVRSPDGPRGGIPFAGVAAVSLLLGLAGVALQGEGAQVALVMIGIWSVVVGASCLAVSSILLSRRIADEGLRPIAWALIAVGIAASTATIFGTGTQAIAPALALAVVGAVTIVASLRLRILRDEPPEAISKREQRRRERGAGS